MKESVQHLFDKQLATWETAKNNYEALAQVKKKELNVNGYTYKVQFNPARIISSAAKVDDKSIRERRCFLCPDNLPTEQKGIVFNEHYSILVNPFPIFPRHYTVPEQKHVKQYILSRFGDMLDLAKSLDNCVIFYNGPKCGASAPDHAHFQAGSKGFLPIENAWKNLRTKAIVTCGRAMLWGSEDSPYAALFIESDDDADAIELFHYIYDALETPPDDNEPMMNVLTWYEESVWQICIFPRIKHRPSCYFAEGDENMLISPASVDLGGAFITPLEKDFDRITAADIAAILKEVCISPPNLRQLIQQIKESL
ncbi:MAG: DUF4922 domain-containing protein [Mediterranea sp.]|jgi:ATP adenylyltransferase/5',5'''-P-1,P-4-tetraphosphate phosphorylase II|nr:DUF4922 domain-containing protein [Mediterranea sp.]